MRRPSDLADRVVPDLVRRDRRVQALAVGVGVVALWAVAAAILPRGLPAGIVALGVVFGSLYGLLAAGLVLVWMSNRVVNFAQAELGGVAAVVAIELVVVGKWNYFAAVAAGLVLAAVIGAVVEMTVIRRFRDAPRLILSVATIGLAQILAGIALAIPVLIQGLTGGRFETPFRASVEIFPVVFRGDHLVALAAVVVAVAALAGFLRGSDVGVAVRAAADNRDRADLLGLPVRRLSTAVWSIAAVLSALAVTLRVPLVGFSTLGSVSGGGNALLLRTLAAAVIGRMESLPRTFAAAVAIGVFQEACLWTTSNTTIADAVLFVVLLVALLGQKGTFQRAAETGISTWRAIRDVRPVPRELAHLPEVRWAGMALKAGVVAGVVLLPAVLRPSQELAFQLVFIYAIVAVSLVILTGWAGQISLGQFALAGIGGATTALLYGRHGIDFMVALPAGAAVAGLASLLIGFPALRIKGPFLAVTTLAFAVTTSSYLLEDRYLPWFVVDRIPRPTLWGRFSLAEPLHRYYLALAGLALAIAVARSLRRARAGRAILAVRENELNAAAVGIDTTRAKLTAFVAAGAIAGFAGSLYVVDQGGVFIDAYDATVSLRLFTMAVIGGLGSLPGAVLGAVFVRSAEFFLAPQYALLFSGVGILLLLLFVPEGLGGLLYRARDAYLRTVARRREILVPTLVADRRLADDEVVAFDAAALAADGPAGVPASAAVSVQGGRDAVDGERPLEGARR